jgi:hypothetical protein
MADEEAPQDEEAAHGAEAPREAEPPKVRYEVILRAKAADRMDLRRVADLDLDRVPDPGGEVRLLVDMEEAARLVESGFEVTLVAAAPAGPLDPSLVMDDDAARAWLEERLRGVEREGQD